MNNKISWQDVVMAETAENDAPPNYFSAVVITESEYELLALLNLSCRWEGVRATVLDGRLAVFPTVVAMPVWEALDGLRMSHRRATVAQVKPHLWEWGSAAAADHKGYWLVDKRELFLCEGDEEEFYLEWDSLSLSGPVVMIAPRKAMKKLVKALQKMDKPTFGAAMVGWAVLEWVKE